MAQLYSSSKIFMAVIFTLFAYAASSQTSPCGPVVQDFNNTGGSMAGFTSSTLLSSAPGFTYGQTGQNGYLQRCNIPAANTVYEITSPTWQPAGALTYVGYGFDLSGAVTASSISVYFQYVDNSNNVNSVWDTTFQNPAYTGSGANSTLSICDSFLLSRATGFTPGEAYRIVVTITASSASNNNQCIIFDNFRTTGTVSQAPLPVTFIGFGARKTDNGVQLIWNVSGERDVQSYIVEKSVTAGNFVRVGDVTASNSTAYSFVDNQPATGTVFYRIKEVDVDGKFRYSTIVRLDLSRSSNLRVYPSPAKDQVTIEHAVTTKGSLSITTSDGRIVKQIDVRPELDQTVINISTLKAGLYIVRFINAGGQAETTKLIKE